jgi:hypothetical protein
METYRGKSQAIHPNMETYRGLEFGELASAGLD